MIDSTDFVAGAPSRDFVNTVGGIRSGHHDDKLESYADLIDWAVLGGTLPRERADALAAHAGREPAAAAALLDEAKAFREALHAVFAAHVSGRAPPPESVALVNAKIGAALAHARLARDGGRYRWSWDDADALDAPLWAVARDAAELLTAGGLDRITECASDTCGWLFLDSTKNHSRRWCDMKGCGNRDKVRRYRTKAAR
jgi:predicted RNA-binding Zn ribbon-like protein